MSVSSSPGASSDEDSLPSSAASSAASFGLELGVELDALAVFMPALFDEVDVVVALDEPTVPDAVVPDAVVPEEVLLDAALAVPSSLSSPHATASASAVSTRLV
jgi:hypothetical protein